MDWSPWLDAALRALDYTAGIGRYAGAGLANIPYAATTGKSLTKTEDLGRVVRGQAPTASEYMERAGAKGSPWLDIGADIALDPTTYLTGGATKIGPVLGMAAIKRGGKAAKAARLAAQQEDMLAKMIAKLEMNPYTKGYKVIEKSHGFESPNLVVDIPGLGKKSIMEGDNGVLHLLDYIDDAAEDVVEGVVPATKAKP